MNTKNRELKILKKTNAQSVWFWTLVLCMAIVVDAFFAYFGIVFKTKFDGYKVLGNDIALSIVCGFMVGLITLILAFVFLQIFKKAVIKDFFSYYCYINSLRNAHALLLIKDQRLLDIYKKKEAMTKKEYMELLAKMLNYSTSSIEYKNLVKNVDDDFRKHSYNEIEPKNIIRLGFLKTFVFNFLIPLIIILALIPFPILYQKDIVTKSSELPALSRLIIIVIMTIFVLNVSIFAYEIDATKKIWNNESFNNYFFFSFNTFSYKYLNSSFIRSE